MWIGHVALATLPYLPLNINCQLTQTKYASDRIILWFLDAHISHSIHYLLYWENALALHLQIYKLFYTIIIANTAAVFIKYIYTMMGRVYMHAYVCVVGRGRGGSSSKALCVVVPKMLHLLRKRMCLNGSRDCRHPQSPHPPPTHPKLLLRLTVPPL